MLINNEKIGGVKMKYITNVAGLIKKVINKEINFRVLYTNTTHNSKIISVKEIIAFTKNVGELGEGVFIVDRIAANNYIIGMYFLVENITETINKEQLLGYPFYDNNTYTSYWKVSGMKFPKPIPFKEAVESTEQSYGLLLNTIQRKLQSRTVVNILEKSEC